MLPACVAAAVAMIALSPYTSELFPTSYRATAMGLFAQVKPPGDGCSNVY
jgi:hypothetical protein